MSNRLEHCLMQLADPITTLNLIACILILAISIWWSYRTESMIPLSIGLAFGFFGISHLANLLSVIDSYRVEFVFIRGFAYILVTIGLIALALDIIRRQKAEQDLRFSQEQFSDLSENAPIGILTTDKGGVITFANHRALTMLGLQGTEGIISSCNLLTYQPLAQTGFSALLEKTLHNGAVPATIEIEFPSPEGKPLQYRAHISPILKHTGASQDVAFGGGSTESPPHGGGQPDIIGGRVILDGVTDRRRAEKAFHLANKKLQLLSSITRHDVRNKIMVIQGYLELLSDHKEDKTLSDYLTQIEAAAASIEHQLEFTRFYESLGVNEPDWVSLEDCLSELDTSGVPIHHDCSGVLIYADPMLSKVFQNLYDNTLRHAEGAVRVQVTCKHRPSSLAIIWEDDGVGIPADQKELIFEYGYGKHTGFGLFFIREILSITGITISETGTPGEGVRFELLVPEGGFQNRYGQECLVDSI
ncbi:MAG: PAS domain-containing sensor histidine kinase [Methanocalculus sp. MSAO_Arc1]|uniref:PAS domain-containing sensor histidine kinase n=1 Tax=Methanocalculus sp. MSAO_Arc1 TaxID=2293854 RepID=UPI000FEE4174|nr:PAS domain-containing sensor histidine kinase [Methanocalculus sp. MSAO_Arc1]RQD79705.1 MAG: PAS domain-containing sensor histidine kinase [Methanocalculus sp. MSAO_Arc1]